MRAEKLTGGYLAIAKWSDVCGSWGWDLFAPGADTTDRSNVLAFRPTLDKIRDVARAHAAGPQ